jgi:hypothetical protein
MSLFEPNTIERTVSGCRLTGNWKQSKFLLDVIEDYGFVLPIDRPLSPYRWVQLIEEAFPITPCIQAVIDEILSE